MIGVANWNSIMPEEDMLISDFIKNKPKLSFDDDPVEIQRALRNEWDDDITQYADMIKLPTTVKHVV